ncbi:radical SAM protein [Desulforamulus aeronauticus]|uniref:biotin synthase n=1 Tax=Desulforamulus aeronauticus DSM 10349 TaxID=1121421 RepID=A0A1M6NA85_9FIRM|nr:radical SAM protein [Desulforamulus aeronauticus]SHJ92564.1 biotin synthase [Desulforamulus aeronauticus DSM 10349]
MSISDLLASIKSGEIVNKDDAISLLNIDCRHDDFYKLLSTANYLSRTEYNNQGLIFAQIGINAEPCSINCRFCSMGQGHYTLPVTGRKKIDEILSELELLVANNIHDFFLMTTADYPVNAFMDIAKTVRKNLPDHIRFVANIGDFNYETAKKLKEIGFTGAYHIHRLREGIDTTIRPEIRINTLNAIRDAGLELYYCVEPIGPEHSYEELVTEMIRARDYHVKVMAVMRRIPVKGTPLYDKGQITAIELSKIAAVARLVTRPKRAMNAHEVTQMTLLAGVNQLYAEYGANPRDTASQTEKNRGFSVQQAQNMLWEAGYVTT